MAKQIKSEEIIERGALSEHIKQAETLISLYDKWDEKLKEVAKESKKLVETLDTTNVKDLRKLAEEQQKVNKAFDQSTEISKKKAKIDQQLQLLRSKEGQELEKRKIQLQEQRKQVKDQIRLNREQEGSIEQLRRKLSLVTTAWKSLSKEERENTKRGRRIVESKKKLTEELKRLEQATGDARRNVGNYSSALDGLGGKFRGAIRLASQFGLALGGVQIIRSSLKVITDFDQAVTDLAAISGKTADELKPLNDQAKELGATTQFTASEITGLQIELAKLGFTTQEITDSTGGIANFAAATGVEIPRAAALAGSALRAFGLETSEIDRVVSTLGVATTKTALDFSKLEAGLSTVAPVAASFGFSIEDTTALLGQLSNAGFDASSAATATRNILLNLADSGGGLAQALGRPVKNAKDLSEGLQELKARGIDLAGALELTDKRSVAAFNTFIENADTLPSLSASITDVNSELTDMADKRLDSVQGQLQLLNSAWEGFLLGTGESVGLVNTLKSAIGFLAENLTTIISVIGKLMAVYAIWIVRQKIVNSGMIDYVKNIPKAIKGTATLSKNMQTGSSNAAKFGASMKGIGWTALIGLAFELASAFWDIASGANEAAFQTEVYNAASQKGQELASQFVSEQTKRVKELQVSAEKELETLRLKGATEEEIAKRELELMAQISDARKEARREVQIEISSLENQYSSQLRTLEQLGVNIDKLPQQLENAGGSFETFRKNLGSTIGDISSATSDILNVTFFGSDIEETGLGQDAALNQAFAKASVDIQKLVNLRKADAELVGEIKLGAEDIERTELKRQGIAKRTTKEYQKQKEEVKEFGSVQDELFERQIEANVSGDAQLAVELSYRKQLLSLQDYHQKYLEEKREVFGKEAELTQAELDAINDLYAEAEREKNEQVRELRFKNLQEYSNLRLEELELDKKIAEQKGETTIEIEKEILAEKLKAIDQEIAYLEERALPADQKRIEVLEKQKIALQGATNQTNKQTDALKNQTNAFRDLTDAFELYADQRIAKLDEEIAKIDELVEASKRREQELSELRAKEGADVAESLAFEQQKQAEALAKKEELERKKRRTELATAVIQLVSSKIEQGSANPTGEAFTEIAAIQGFIQSLPQFWEGTDTTVGDKLGMKYSNERDGVIARIDPSEMVLNKDKVDSLRSMGVNSTDDIVNVAKMWKSSNAIQSSHDFGIVQTAKPQFDSKGIEKELSQLKTENSQMKGYLKELSNRPSHVFEGKMMNDYFDFIEKKISNNKEVKTYRRFR